MLLQYMEQSPVYSNINFNFCAGYNYGFVCNSTPVFTSMAVFLCPSDNNSSGSARFNAGWGNFANPPGNNNYRGSVGTTSQSGYNGASGGAGYGGCQPDPYNINGGQPGCTPASTGIFAYWISYGLRDVTDGSSNTAAFTESLVGTPNGAVTNTRNNGITGVTAAQPYDAYDATSQLAGGNLYAALNACTAAYKAGGANLVNDNGVGWAWGAVGMTLFNTIVPPNSTTFAWNDCRSSCGACSPDDSLYSNSQSNHPGGCNSLMADGSVRFIKATVSQTTYLALGTRANNESISADSY